MAKTKPLWVNIGDGIHGLDGDAGQDWDLAALFSEAFRGVAQTVDTVAVYSQTLFTC